MVAQDPFRVVFIPKHTTSQLLHGTFLCLYRQTHFNLSFFSAFHTPVLRRDLLHALSTIRQDNLEPWALLGDFNNVLDPNERVNGTNVTNYEIRNLEELCTEIAIEDITYNRPFSLGRTRGFRVSLNKRWLIRNGLRKDSFATLSSHDRVAIRFMPMGL